MNYLYSKNNQLNVDKTNNIELIVFIIIINQRMNIRITFNSVLHRFMCQCFFFSFFTDDFIVVREL